MSVLEAKPYRLKLETPYRWSKGVQHYRSGLILRADFDGAIGWGEAAFPPHIDFAGDAMAQICRGFFDGLDPAAPDFLAQLDLRECPPRLRCGIATAVHTAHAHAACQSLVAYLAGEEGRAIPEWVPVNELIGDADVETCVQRAAAAVELGQDTVKVKCTPERELDLTRVRAIRAAFPRLKIRIDPNESWPLEWAARQLEAMAPYEIEYCEEPLPRGTSLHEYARLRKQTRVPIALDDSARTLFHVERIIELSAADALVLKAQRVGGPDRCHDIIRRAEQHGVACTVTASLETSVGLYVGVHCAALAAEPIAAAGIGTARFFAENVGDPPRIVKGHMRVPSSAGLGFEPEPWWSMHS